jgi:hypothetical protein
LLNCFNFILRKIHNFDILIYEALKVEKIYTCGLLISLKQHIQQSFIKYELKTDTKELAEKQATARRD